MNAKLVETLGVSDFVANPVWEFINNDALGETAVRPVEKIPVENLDGRIIGIHVRLANGKAVWASIGNVDIADPRATEHFLIISIENAGQWFHLARYHDIDYEKRGPEALARFLGLPVHEVFPISYDFTQYVRGEAASLSGTILKEPREKRTQSELIHWAVERTV
jgi:hypothetical protein